MKFNLVPCVSHSETNSNDKTEADKTAALTGSGAVDGQSAARDAGVAVVTLRPATNAAAWFATRTLLQNVNGSIRV